MPSFRYTPYSTQHGRAQKRRCVQGARSRRCSCSPILGITSRTQFCTYLSSLLRDRDFTVHFTPGIRTIRRTILDKKIRTRTKSLIFLACAADLVQFGPRRCGLTEDRYRKGSLSLEVGFWPRGGQNASSETRDRVGAVGGRLYTYPGTYLYPC